MPEICRFFGIVIRMDYGEHGVSHYHAAYGRHRIAVAIEGLTVLSGALPPRALGLALEWASQHREDLLDNWERMRRAERPKRLPPLQ